MILQNPNKPAFPITEEETDRIEEGIRIHTGLTKREYFAGLAMQGVLTDSRLSAEEAVEIATRAADHLLKQLEKPQS
jgi:hypothetical protein